MKNEKIDVLQPERVAHHKMASEHRDMTDLEFEALKLDIELNGQIMPVILYKGKLVDGRHRQRALIELGIHDMKCISLAGNISLIEVRNKVMGTEVRRADNLGQKSIRAYKWLNEEPGRTQGQAGIKFGIAQASVSEAKRIYDKIAPETIDRYYNQGYLLIDRKRQSTLRGILKAFDVQNQIPPTREPLTKQQEDIMSMLNTMNDAGDKAGIAIIESYAKRMRMSE